MRILRIRRYGWSRLFRIVGSFPLLAAVAVFLFANRYSHAQEPSPSPVQQTQDPITIPFTDPEGVILVDGSINGKPVVFVVDSGAGTEAITSDTAHRLGISGGRRGPIRHIAGVNGTIPANVVTLENIEIPGVTISDSNVVIIPDLKDYNTFGGILGYNFLNQFVTTIDYQKHTLTLSDPARFTPASGTSAIRFRLQNGAPRIPIELDGIPAEVELDTGDNGFLDLNAGFVDRNHLRSRYRRALHDQGGEGIGGWSPEDIVRANWLTVGNERLRAPIIALTSSRPSGQSDGRLGEKIIKRFTVTLDYSRQMVYLAPNESIADPFLLRNKSGLRFENIKSVYTVTWVIPGSPAAIAGIQPGDQIYSVNKIRHSQLTFDSLSTEMRRDSGTMIQMLIRSHSDGKVRPVKFTLRQLI